MNLNKKIGVLLDNGFKPEFISSLTESKINFLFEKISKRKENKEQTQPGVTTTITTEKVTSIDTSALSGDKGVNVGGNINLQMQGGKVIARQMKEGEISEKFESKAQQGLFWARCNKCKSKDCEWCKLADEFSKKTSKKQYETMPEKKHPEKTVKYKKKNTNEEFTMANYLDKVGSTYTNIAKGKLTKEEFIKNQINKIVEDNLQPTMKKRDLLRLIESESKKRKNLNEDFYYGDMEEDFDMMSRYEGDDTNWEEEEETDADWYEWDTEEDTPGPRGKLKMSDPYEMPTIEPGIKEPKIKPREPDVEPEWEPDFNEPIVPDEDTETEPQARRRNKDFMKGLREEFNRSLNRLDNVTHKPIKYRKY